MNTERNKNSNDEANTLTKDSVKDVEADFTFDENDNTEQDKKAEIDRLSDADR